jgi:hypothetical protein
MSLVYTISLCVIGGIGIYQFLKKKHKEILKKLEEDFILIRETADNFEIMQDKITNKQVELQDLKAGVYSIIEDKENQNKDLESQYNELMKKDNKTQKENEKLSKIRDKIKKNDDVIKEAANSEQIEKIEKDIEELKNTQKKYAKIDLSDLNPSSQFYINEQTKKLIKKAKDQVEKGIGVVEIHSDIGSKLYFKKYRKIMVIDGKTYFHNPAKVRNSWYGLPVIHFDEGDPEAKNMGNTYTYPMSGEEITATIFDQKIPEEDKSNGFEINRMVLYAVMVVVMIAFVIYIFFSGDSTTATTVAQNTTTVVN